MPSTTLPELFYTQDQAQAGLSKVLRLVDQGHAVHITQQGQPKAVLVSEAWFQAQQLKPQGWFAFSQQWRECMQQAGLAFMNDEELQGLRSDADRRDAPML